MTNMTDIKKYFRENSAEFCYPQEKAYRGFSEKVCKEEGDLACLALASALQRYADKKSNTIYYSDSSWSKIDLDKLIEMLDKFGTGELQPEEENDFAI